MSDVHPKWQAPHERLAERQRRNRSITMGFFSEALDLYRDAVLARQAFDETHETLGSFWKEDRAKLDAKVAAKRTAIIDFVKDLL